ncbi:hypothetical protein [Segniliparus rugosus]|uniref:Secreted protein n=1 Tax=Segniliparus rugosus (strain ATCC BAA-974 / DSM 45345 / CCUG 50838 / CIP 108380 / JCM 13579 / CDC 945) TaxID=679197 RepID=E5XSD3_SEGRC|nr:hypothetical protein [Segniliparus rugosus]EFV12753.1 hypothetical protein HMPREF9336_02405 [Segniliparus rugosus ATCC BAA-974]
MRRRLAGAFIALLALWPTLAPGARADTPEFPDLDGYAWTSPDWFFRHGTRPMTAEFSTPDGLYCWVTWYLEMRYGCDGQLPGAPAGVNSVRVQHGKPGQFLNASSHDIPGAPAMALEPNHYFNDAGVVCLVDDDGMTACGYGDHGFILKPSGSVAW